MASEVGRKAHDSHRSTEERVSRRQLSAGPLPLRKSHMQEENSPWQIASLVTFILKKNV